MTDWSRTFADPIPLPDGDPPKTTAIEAQRIGAMPELELNRAAFAESTRRDILNTDRGASRTGQRLVLSLDRRF